MSGAMLIILLSGTVDRHLLYKNILHKVKNIICINQGEGGGFPNQICQGSGGAAPLYTRGKAHLKIILLLKTG